MGRSDPGFGQNRILGMKVLLLPFFLAASVHSVAITQTRLNDRHEWILAALKNNVVKDIEANFENTKAAVDFTNKTAAKIIDHFNTKNKETDANVKDNLKKLAQKLSDKFSEVDNAAEKNLENVEIACQENMKNLAAQVKTSLTTMAEEVSAKFKSQKDILTTSASTCAFMKRYGDKGTARGVVSPWDNVPLDSVWVKGEQVTGALDQTTGEFTAPVDGVYQASFTVTLDVDTRDRHTHRYARVPKFFFHTAGVGGQGAHEEAIIVATVGHNEVNNRSDLNYVPAARTLLLNLKKDVKLTVRQNVKKPEVAHLLSFCVHLVQQDVGSMKLNTKVGEPKISIEPEKAQIGNVTALQFEQTEVDHTKTAENPKLPKLTLTPLLSNAKDGILNKKKDNGLYDPRHLMLDINTDYYED